MLRQFIRRARIYAKRLVHSQHTSHDIALGVAIGIFSSVAMPYLTHLLVAIALAYVFRVNKIAALLGTLFNNPLTAAPIYIGALALGCAVCQVEVELPPGIWEIGGLKNFWLDIMAYGHTVLVPMLTGLFLVALAAALLGYVMTRFIVDGCRTRRDRKGPVKGRRKLRHKRGVRHA